jgi:hypothetical protein
MLSTPCIREQTRLKTFAYYEYGAWPMYGGRKVTRKGNYLGIAELLRMDTTRDAEI